jgi:deoxyribodipyrimidine photolyase-related protein
MPYHLKILQPKVMKILRLVLGDQLNSDHSWFQEINPDVNYILMEIRQETDYVRHHIQKILSFFAALQDFAQELKNDGHQIIYLKINDKNNTHSLTKNIQQYIVQNKIEKFEYMLPDEYRLDQQLNRFCHNLDIPTQVYDTEHFLTERHTLSGFFAGKKTFRMENFYRMMRRTYNIFMDGQNPLGGKWNYDIENRQNYDGKVPIPAPKRCHNDVRNIFQAVENAGIKFFGSVTPEQLDWPINRKQAKSLLDFFTDKLLPYFGTYQDAMTEKSWSLFHSRLSFALNTKILSPLEVINKAISAWEKRQDEITFPQIEGFVRQILGWREYMRGIYWAKMPEYQTLNYFNHHRNLPEYFWTSETRMKCLKESISQSLNYAYAHHIQRLMVTGNFALLAGIDPEEVDLWYLGIYIDAIQWVEITNTRGMSQFADGGIVGSKPYVSSANYIDKMSDYCQNCYYDKARRYGNKSCPFNSLYWHFYNRHRDKLQKNPRVAVMYRTLDRMKPEERTKIIRQAAEYLENLEDL